MERKTFYKTNGCVAEDNYAVWLPHRLYWAHKRLDASPPLTLEEVLGILLPALGKCGGNISIIDDKIIYDTENYSVEVINYRSSNPSYPTQLFLPLTFGDV